MECRDDGCLEKESGYVVQLQMGVDTMPDHLLSWAKPLSLKTIGVALPYSRRQAPSIRSLWNQLTFA